MADTIDFGKVDAAFQHLANSNEGQSALDQLGKALDNVGSTVNPQLNRSERHYLLTHLVQQRQAAFGPGLVGSAAANAGGVVKHGFLIKTAVPE